MALCGNGVVEEGEECDCGWEEDCEEECCWPQRTDYPKGQKPCTLRPNKPCSPTQVIRYLTKYLLYHIFLFLFVNEFDNDFLFIHSKGTLL